MTTFTIGKGKANNMSSKPQCQLCQSFGHTIWQRFYRFDETFQLKNVFDDLNASNTVDSEVVSAMLTETLIKELIGDRSLGNENEIQYYDFGMSHHCTPAMEDLEVKADYEGNDKVLVGNGAGLNISSIGHSDFISRNHV